MLNDYIDYETLLLIMALSIHNHNLYKYNNNIHFIFQINNPYNPIVNGVSDPLQIAIYEALLSNINKNFVITIEEGFYNPTQMATELTNKFNEAVTGFLLNYFFILF